ncbi:32974_t:CDS:1, partial [Racocetra persica]
TTPTPRITAPRIAIPRIIEKAKVIEKNRLLKLMKNKNKKKETKK